MPYQSPSGGTVARRYDGQVVAILVLAFLVVPFLELAVIVQVAGGIGLANTIGLLILVSIVGAWLAKREGVGVARRFQFAVQQGRAPAREVVDGALVLFAGALLLTPGFLTDLLAVVLLLPPSRAVVRGMILRSLRNRVVLGR
jgi:UPF0716 protein FxsA